MTNKEFEAAFSVVEERADKLLHLFRDAMSNFLNDSSTEARPLEKADVVASVMAIEMFRGSLNGFLVESGVPQAAIDAFRRIAQRAVEHQEAALAFMPKQGEA